MLIEAADDAVVQVPPFSEMDPRPDREAERWLNTLLRRAESAWTSSCFVGSANRLSAVGRLEVGAPRKGGVLVQHFVEVVGVEGLTEPSGQAMNTNDPYDLDRFVQAQNCSMSISRASPTNARWSCWRGHRTTTDFGSHPDGFRGRVAAA